MLDIVYAAAGGGGGGGGTSAFSGFIPIILLFGVFYFLLIRPQQKKSKEHRGMIERLKRDDQVITTGGLYGRITGITENSVTLEIAEKVRVKVLRGQISAVVNPAEDREE
ncbi:MAG: preprotein translocase subunit YajC [Thermodesulfobacteriota bacterium]